MPKPKEAACKHRTLWLSDVHLGSPGCKARRLVRFLRQNDCEQLYLVGDIFDGWKLKTKFYWTPDHTRVIKAILGDRARDVPVSSTKSMHGHLLGAAGALELVATLLALGRGVAPPTINLRVPDPECDLDYVPNQPRPQRVTHALSNSFGFGGQNVSLVFSAFKG